jgi:hypothetical protein
MTTAISTLPPPPGLSTSTQPLPPLAQPPISTLSNTTLATIYSHPLFAGDGADASLLGDYTLPAWRKSPLRRRKVMNDQEKAKKAQENFEIKKDTSHGKMNSSNGRPSTRKAAPPKRVTRAREDANDDVCRESMVEGEKIKSDCRRGVRSYSELDVYPSPSPSPSSGASSKSTTNNITPTINNEILETLRASSMIGKKTATIKRERSNKVHSWLGAIEINTNFQDENNYTEVRPRSSLKSTRGKDGETLADERLTAGDTLQGDSYSRNVAESGELREDERDMVRKLNLLARRRRHSSRRLY